MLRRLGLERAALDLGTGEEGTAWVDEDGREATRFLTDDEEGEGPTAEMEILRGDLARLLADHADGAATRFGDHVTSVEDGGGAARVTFASGTVETYDVVVVAEGVGSATRELVFPGENDPRWMNLILGYFTIPRIATDDRIWRWFNAPSRRSVSLRPDRHGTARAMLSLWKKPEGEQDWDVGRQRAFLRERFADAGWETPRILAGMDGAEDFYFDVLRQVRMPRWSSGRVVLTGDAAWCATPLAGIGATLAVTGAFVLAEELARHADATDAFAAYERQMRPMVEEGQGVPKAAPKLMHPNSRLGIRLLHGTLDIASSESLRGLASRFLGGTNKEPDLSRYDEDPVIATTG